MVTKVRFVFALLLGFFGWFFGSAMGLALFGTAIVAAWVFVPLLALLGFFMGPDVVDKIARWSKRREDKS
ncbi:hypothetical protein KUV51_20650 [Tateyamaria omphalii]|uniref:hypothetical protein n=1 Tax=Tateyamaria omphalii TaxID=299262 RepID=UPI001C9A1FC8|nr:hypothetical protein [Tateyamaria omphalii]MBY5935429.1 hypothetical protein [Tateyamaria omphalii]